MTERKREKPLGLDMRFEEALNRFAGVDPDEMPDNQAREEAQKEGRRRAAAQ